MRLLQLSDSAVPIGSAAHSFGLETLVHSGAVAPHSLEEFLRAQIEEPLAAEAVFCRCATAAADLDELNAALSAMLPAREIRQASLAIGRRFWSLFRNLYSGGLPDVDGAAMHHAVAFGTAGRVLEIPPDLAVVAWMQQAVTTLISAAVRLMPLGQSAAQSLLWRLGPHISSAMERTRGIRFQDIFCLAPGLDIAAMRHPALETRLFIS